MSVERKQQPGERGKRLYVDLSEWGGRTRYVVFSPDLLPVLAARTPKLSRLDLLLLLHICMSYDNASESDYQPVSMSYGELAELFNAGPSSVRRSLAVLEYENLIIKGNAGERSGRCKYAYQPNVNRIQSELREYLKNNGRIP